MKINIPDIANGSLVPPAIQENILKEEQEKELLKKQRRHDYYVAIVSAIAGAIATNFDRIIDFIKEIAT